MVSCLDSFIAKKDDSVWWLESSDRYEKGDTLTDEDVADFISTVDCYVMGSRTYELALKLGWPYGSNPFTVLTNRALMTDRENVEFYSGDLGNLVNDHLKMSYRNIWIVGGAMLAKEFIRLKLGDVIIIAGMPIILGDGKLFFDFIGQEQKLHLKDMTAYKDGMVELQYEIKK